MIICRISNDKTPGIQGGFRGLEADVDYWPAGAGAPGAPGVGAPPIPPFILPPAGPPIPLGAFANGLDGALAPSGAPPGGSPFTTAPFSFGSGSLLHPVSKQPNVNAAAAIKANFFIEFVS